MALYKVMSQAYFGPVRNCAMHSLHPLGSIIEMADDARPSLYWLPLDAEAEAAIKAEQERQAQIRGGTAPDWSAWGGCLPHGVGGVSGRTDGGPPIENWPPPGHPTPAPTRSWPLGRSRLAKHNRG